jgi:predicted dehydrogenase
MNRKIGVGLFGGNGHQVHHLLEGCAWGEVVAHAAWDAPEGCGIRRNSLDELLADPAVELVSLCSPRRVDQPAHAIACLRAGKHVYAEKPAAFSDQALDEILAIADAEGREFHEMADTVFQQPFFALRECVRSGRIGTVVQVWAQKSYPANFDRRPQDEDVDGGLTRQAAIHAVRMIEHICGLRVNELDARETKLGNPLAGELRTASCLNMTLENGGLAAVVANYCNPRGFGRHGNDQVRVFGTKGIAEITDDGQRSRVVVGDEDLGPLDTSTAVESPFHTYLRKLLGLAEMPMSREEELHPLRVVSRAKAAAKLAEPL